MDGTQAEQFLQDLNEAVDDAHTRINKLEGKVKLNQLAILLAGIGAAGSGFLAWHTAKAVRNLAAGIEPMGQAVHKLLQDEQQRGAVIRQQVVAEQNGSMAPPAQGPVTEAPEWVKEANLKQSAREVMEQVDKAAGAPWSDGDV